jgi:hypothetical protein
MMSFLEFRVNPVMRNEERTLLSISGLSCLGFFRLIEPEGVLGYGRYNLLDHQNGDIFLIWALSSKTVNGAHYFFMDLPICPFLPTGSFM